jgi:hypothetical protein
LIKFKNKKAPEKQEIDLSFRSNIAGVEGIILDEGMMIRRPTRYGPKGIFLRISHTERTWGVDIESLMTNHIKRFITSFENSERFVSRHSGKIGFTAGVLFFLSAIVGVIYTSSNFIDSYTTRISELSNGVHDKSIILSSKIDFLINIISTGAWPRFIFSVVVFLVICLIISIFVGGWVGASASSEPESFVLLSKAAEEKRKKIINRMKRDWKLFWLSVIASIGTGIAANILFTKFFSDLASN